MCKISFIVPVYNVEQYLSECIESILLQTITDYELIIVDDGSPDNSGAIADSYALKESRITVIHKQNEGVSVARNVGFLAATGEYILYVDSDDYLEPGYAEYFLKLIESNRADIAVSKKCFNEWNKDFLEYNNTVQILRAEDAMISLYMGEMGVAVWNKIYRRQFLIDNNILFLPQFWFGEGMTYNIVCFSYAERVVMADGMFYHQRYNPNSAVRKFNLESFKCGLRAMDYQRSIWSSCEERLHVLENAWLFHKNGYNISILKGIYETNLKLLYKNEIVQAKRNLRKNIFLPLKVRLPAKRKIKGILEAIFPDLMIARMIKKERIAISEKKN